MLSSEKLAVRNFGVRGLFFFFFFRINLFVKVLFFEENAKYSFIIQILTLKIKCSDSACFPQQMVEVSDAFIFPFYFMGLAKYYLPEHDWFFYIMREGCGVSQERGSERMCSIEANVSIRHLNGNSCRAAHKHF